MSTTSHAETCRIAADAVAGIPAAFAPPVLVGFDGFVDSIIDVVQTRESPSSYEAMPTIATLGARITAAAGKSANIELVVKQTKIGGNGPIMANALCAQLAKVTAVGVLGEAAIDPVFQPLAERAVKVVSLGAPAFTDALEFADGKLMLGKHFYLANVNYERLVKAVGGVPALKDMFRSAQGIATVNWTMCMGLTEIWRRLAADVLPGLRKDRPKWFVDLADPAKRTAEDLQACGSALRDLQQHADVVLGLNEAECRQVLNVMGMHWPVAQPEWEAARQACVQLRERLGVSLVMCHLVKSSACAWEGGSVGAEGFFEPKPKLTTGAGDHFNAGFFSALLAGLPPVACLQAGGATSGHYVRTGQSPTRAQVVEFLRSRAK
jgi:hypothetical protein